jgi:hypothetical protein
MRYLRLVDLLSRFAVITFSLLPINACSCTRAAINARGASKDPRTFAAPAISAPDVACTRIVSASPVISADPAINAAVES